MKLVKVGAGLLAAGLMAGAQADVVTMSQNFDTFAPPGWSFTNNSDAPSQSWFAGNSSVFSAQSGAAGSYAAANFNSSGNLNGVIDNWLISPMFTLGLNPTLDFYTQGAADDLFFDMLEVRYSSGASVDVSNFTELLVTIGDGSSQYPAGVWTHYSLTLPAEVEGRIGFRYVSSDASIANYIGIDTVSASASSVTNPVPEPGTLALTALALAGSASAARRRKQSVSTPLPA